MKNTKLFILLAMAILTLGSVSCTKNNDMTDNPLMRPSTLPLGAPDFANIRFEHFEPAILAGIEEKKKEIDSIANNAEPPTFENTLVAMERSGQLLSRAYGTLAFLGGANTSEEIQALEEKLSPQLAALSNSIYLNEKLFERVKAIYESRDTLYNVNNEAARLAEVYYENFVLRGANVAADQRAKFKELSEEEAVLSTRFGNKLLNAAKAAAYSVKDKQELKGLNEDVLGALAANAKQNNKDGYLIPIHNTTQQPLLASLEDRDTRRKLFEAAWTRAEQNDDNDTRAIITRLANLRAQQAELLGFKNFAEWNLKDQMAKTPEAAMALMQKLVPGAAAKAQREAARIQQLIDEQQGGITLEAYDWDYYAEKVRNADYALDESLIKPYLLLDNVLEHGVFYATQELYGLTFKERTDLPLYHEDVRVFDVLEKSGDTLALFYFDPYKRDNKSGGAWMGNFVEQSYLLGHKPVIYNVCNFAKPAGDAAALISWDDVNTLFHEFGHTLHGLFASQIYPSLSGTNVPRDFVEMPSQIYEHWATYPKVFNNYAKHYADGTPMPAPLVEKLMNTQTFNQGYALTEVLKAALLDMSWHTLTSADTVSDVDKFEQEALSRTGLTLPQVPPRYRSSYFLHIWGHGYAAGYYAYLWGEMLDNDAFSWFESNGGLTRDNGQRFRDMVLSKGNSEDLEQVFKAFRGREPDITPMLRNRGL